MLLCEEVHHKETQGTRGIHSHCKYGQDFTLMFIPHRAQSPVKESSFLNFETLSGVLILVHYVFVVLVLLSHHEPEHYKPLLELGNQEEVEQDKF